MIIPSPLYPCVMEPVPAAEAAKLADSPDVEVYVSNIIEQAYIVIPSVLISPVVEVAAKTRHLFCWRCNQTTEHTYDAWHSVYRCACGGESNYIVVTKDGKL